MQIESSRRLVNTLKWTKKSAVYKEKWVLASSSFALLARPSRPLSVRKATWLKRLMPLTSNVLLAKKKPRASLRNGQAAETRIDQAPGERNLGLADDN
jgi:hypothetical protein